ncbi:mRNA decay activator protein ZFP36L2 isoform X1 [Pipistrellus kuhlii]|uniref:mRNA decay activator protein ZFP36L2 isoform X1 n=1 Tax=Pipistrellus kuhlii TaxID=59472 RepID=UPI001E273196|nr:mRNA decay activator protein ZFP36L2 isoform X1 [Pipistrellus kuhlii]XP_045436648.1 mRNA decay activator protein ZFP36L2 isoform X1 [Pipistrellus kuhlii]
MPPPPPNPGPPTTAQHPLQTSRAAPTVAVFLHFAIPARSLLNPWVGVKIKRHSAWQDRAGKDTSRTARRRQPRETCWGFSTVRPPRREAASPPPRPAAAAAAAAPPAPSQAELPGHRGPAGAPPPGFAPPPARKKIGGGQWEAGKAPDVRWPAGSLLPGDPSGASPSPPPARGWLYRARARLPPSSSSPRAAAGSALGGGRAGLAPRGAEEQRSWLLLLFPPRRTPRGTLRRVHAAPPSPSFLAPRRLRVPPPPLSRYPSWLLRSGSAAAPKAPSDLLPACSPDPYRIQKHVDHTSARLLRHRLLVQDGEIPGQPPSEQHAGQEGGGHARGRCRRPQRGLHAGLPPTALGQQPARARPPRGAQPGQLLAQVPGRAQRRRRRRGGGEPGCPLQQQQPQGAVGGRRRRRRHRAAQQGEQIPGPLLQRERRAQPAPPAPAAAAAAAEGRRRRRQRLPDQLHALQDGAVPALRGERHVQVRREVPVRPRLPRAAQPDPPPQVQDGAVPHLPHHRLLPLRAALPLHPQRGRAAARALGRRRRRGRLLRGGPARLRCPRWRRRAGPGLPPGAAAQAASQPQLLGLPVGPPPPASRRRRWRGPRVVAAAAARQPHVPHAAAAAALLLLGLLLLLLFVRVLLLLLHLRGLHALGRPDVLCLLCHGGGCSGGGRRAPVRYGRRRRPAGPRRPVRRLLGRLLRQQRLRLRPGAHQPHHAARHPDPQLRRRGRRLLPLPAAAAAAAGPGAPRAAAQRAPARRRAALAALQLPAAAPPVRVARVRRAPEPPGLAVGPRQLPERLPELRQPQRLRVPQPGPRPPPAHLQPPLHLRRLRSQMSLGLQGGGKINPAPAATNHTIPYPHLKSISYSPDVGTPVLKEVPYCVCLRPV